MEDLSNKNSKENNISKNLNSETVIEKGILSKQDVTPQKGPGVATSIGYVASVIVLLFAIFLSFVGLGFNGNVNLGMYLYVPLAALMLVISIIMFLASFFVDNKNFFWSISLRILFFILLIPVIATAHMYSSDFIYEKAVENTLCSPIILALSYDRSDNAQQCYRTTRQCEKINNDEVQNYYKIQCLTRLDPGFDEYGIMRQPYIKSVEGCQLLMKEGAHFSDIRDCNKHFADKANKIEPSDKQNFYQVDLPENWKVLEMGDNHSVLVGTGFFNPDAQNRIVIDKVKECTPKDWDFNSEGTYGVTRCYNDYGLRAEVFMSNDDGGFFVGELNPILNSIKGKN